MATNKAAKKFLYGLCVIFLLIAGLGIWFTMSLQRKHAGDLRTTFLDGFEGTKLQYYSLGDPDVHISDILIKDHLAYYIENLEGTSPKFDSATNILSATDAKYSGQLVEGDLIEFRSPSDPENSQVAEVEKLLKMGSFQLVPGANLNLKGDESFRLLRPFTGTVYRFHGTRDVLGVNITYDTLSAPSGMYYDHHGHLHKGKPPKADDAHGGGHGGGHGEEDTHNPNKRPGIYKAYYRIWPLGKYYRHLKYECHYVDGIKSGTENYWNPDGTQPWSISWKNGKKDGRYQEWYEGGKVKLIANYKMGKLHGPYLESYPNGNFALKTNYTEGKLDGLYQTWNDNKDEVHNRRYKMGEPWEKPKGGGGGGGH
jgi:antitoxin component YwqK of YwqJK toxin-antitoxin module